MYNMRYFKQTKNKVFILLLIFLTTIAGLIFVNTPTFAFANSSAVDRFLPSDNLEYKALDTPIDVYSDDTVTAIAGGNQKLTVHYNGKYTELDGFAAIKQVKKFNDNTLLVSDYGNIYTISLTENFLKTELPEMGGNYFDVNKDYLIAAYSGTARVYKINSNKFNFLSSFSLDADKPVAINDKNEIFFYNSNGICKLLANKTSEKPVILTTDAPSKMIADSNFIYYLTENQTYVTKLSISTLEKTNLKVSDIDKDYQLGNLISPSGISFKNNNLLLTDSELNAVQEFKVENENLIFTGFAVASGKTAFNRSSKNAVAIEYYDNKVAILDENKLLVAKNERENYDRENFKNYLKGNKDDVKTFGGTMPNSMALGKDSVLLSFNHEKNNGYLKILNLNDDTLSNNIGVSNCVIQEVTYQSGYYYVLLIRLEGVTHKETLVYKLSETANELTKTAFTTNFNATGMTVDVFGNVYLNNSSGEIRLFSKDTGFKDTKVGSLSGIKKTATDLGGTLFALTNNGLKYFEKNSFKSVTGLEPESGDTIKSFAMSFENKNVFLLFNNKEYVCSTDALTNLALSEVTVSKDEFITTASSADKDDLKVATVKDGANIYSVLKEKESNKLIYDKLSNKQREYAYICEVKMSDSLTLCVLAGQDEIVLVNKKELTFSAPIENISVPKSAFVTTDVNAYFIPIILKETQRETEFEEISFALSDGEKTIRLIKGTQISPVSEITFLTREQGDEIIDITYYFASFTVNGKTHSGYIPVSFTVPVLSEDFAWNEYRIETVKKTTVYKSEDLTESIYQLSDGDKVEVVEDLDGKLKIKLKVSDGYIEGYISAEAVKNDAKLAVRNILIILIISVCVLGTSLFLILRKKHS